MSDSAPKQRNEQDPVDPIVLAAIGRAVSAVALRFARKWGMLDRREMESEAWQACLPAVKNYKPEHGPAEAYFFTISRRALGKFCSQTVAAVSMGKKAAEGAKYQARVEISHLDREEIHHRYVERYGERVGDAAETVVLRREEDAEAEAFRDRIRDLFEQAMNGWEEWDKFVARRLHGMDGYRAEKPRELAERLQVPVRRIYKVHAKLEKEMWRIPALYIMHKER